VSATQDDAPRPAFYALAPGGWRDYVTLLHLPYTAWHLSYVAIGAALAPALHSGRLGAALLAFLLAVGVGAHALDELNGRPLGTRIPEGTLWSLALASVGGAAAIGIVGVGVVGPWLLAFVAAGVFLVFAYSLELWDGRFHGDLWFALAWGGFPVLCGYFAMAEDLRPEALLAAGFATALSLAQRQLSTAVRDARRRMTAVRGTIERRDGSVETITRATLVGRDELALRMLAAASVLLAVALVTARLA
jgi:hypothetical protein